MKRIMMQMSWIILFFLPIPSFAWQFSDFWQTADQKGALLLKNGKAQQAAQVFRNQEWQGVSYYRSQNYEQSLQRFNKQKTSDGQYNAGNAAAHLGRYEEAIKAYNKAIALNPHNTDAMTNREIVKKLLDKKNKQNKSCSKNSSNSSPQNEKNNKDDKSANNQPKKAQNQAQNNSSSSQNKPQQSPSSLNKDQNKENEKTTASNDQQKNIGADNKGKDQSANSSSTRDNNGSESQQNKLDSKQTMPASVSSQQQARDENQKQLLRRLSDEPGGLLRQKFLRDYFRRHPEYMSEGGNTNEDL